MKYKGCLVVKVIAQKKCMNFDEIFSLIVKITSIKVTLGLVVSLDLELEQMDMKMTFFHGCLEKEIYIEQLEDFVTKGKGRLINKLKNSLNELK